MKSNDMLVSIQRHNPKPKLNHLTKNHLTNII